MVAVFQCQLAQDPTQGYYEFSLTDEQTAGISCGPRISDPASLYEWDIEIEDAGEGFYRVLLHYGFMEEVDIPRDLAQIERCGPAFNMMTTSFFLGRQKLIAAKTRPGMAACERFIEPE